MVVVKSLFLFSLSFTLFNVDRRYDEGGGRKEINLVILYKKRILKRGNYVTTL